jgi:hypothetical protein
MRPLFSEAQNVLSGCVTGDGQQACGKQAYDFSH